MVRYFTWKSGSLALTGCVAAMVIALGAPRELPCPYLYNHCTSRTDILFTRRVILYTRLDLCDIVAKSAYQHDYERAMDLV